MILAGPAWADGKLAELAKQLGKMVEHPKSKSTQPRFARICVTLYICSPTLCAKNTVPCENSCLKIIGGVHLVGKRLHIACRKEKSCIKSIRLVAMRERILEVGIGGLATEEDLPLNAKKGVSYS